jgi:Asp-tRNA(Asn)/Glu-tRNA(Gln) amidotransferase A subunit family amidase
MPLDRRAFLNACTTAGVASPLFPGILYTLAAQAQDSAATDQSKPPKITSEMIDQAAILAGIGPFTAEQKQMMIDGLIDQNGSMKAIRKLHLPNSVTPAYVFHPLPAAKPGASAEDLLPCGSAEKFIGIDHVGPGASAAPARIEDLAFAPVTELAAQLRARHITSLALTQMYIDRLKRYDPTLHFVITFTEERAIAQAKAADAEIAAGKYRGPLHGIPWGAKDLLAVKGYPTTWGAGGFEHQTFDEDATVVQRLDAAGAVLVAKLTLGALAEGDVWFGGITRNPWNPAQGSSGSSAGPASATAAGCVAFSIGSETLGSISSPSTRCGCTGLRPTFGHVPRTGAMALSWSMDKLGPICRAVEDCALVLEAIYGPDGEDRSVQYAAFNWDADLNWRRLRVGYLKSDFEFDPEKLAARVSRFGSMTEEDKQTFIAQAKYDHQFDAAALKKLAEMGVHMTPVELPKYPFDSMLTILSAEAAAAFDELTRTGRDKLLVSQGPFAWPNTFRTARFIPAVEYIQAMRARFLAMEAMNKAVAGFDVIVAPTGGEQLTVTNLTGHPALILPNGFRGADAPPAAKPAKSGVIDSNYGGPGTPVSLTFLAPLYGEAKLLAFARAYQDATTFHLGHPKL